MSSSVRHNSLVMAAGTAASRITGQIRTILLAAAVGTTGLAANAYQAGSQIPQVIFTLVAGGIFNAVLVPQIVRTLENEDAEDRLNKLITFAIAMLLAVTVVVAAFTPLLTRLYVNGDSDMFALSTAFALWCVPQIFFYGLYTVVGQILAAKDHFGAYAWSSVGANLISCAGFAAFIALFGRADRQPLEYWTIGKLALTAGTWTLGVAFQALVLFAPLARTGLHYRPSWGLRGIGLRMMGPVAAWSLGIVVIDQLQTIVNQRVMTSVPDAAMRMLHLSEFDVAGNASFQNAYTIYILPYSLIAVSIATAVFPKISQAISVDDIDDARRTLSDAMRNSWLLMCFFTVAFLVIPVPITRALLPSVNISEAILISGPLTTLAFGLPVAAVTLIVQRTFYAFEDGCRPFIFTVLVTGSEIVLLLPGTLMFSPANWATLLGATMSAGYVVTFPVLLWQIVKRFDGRLDGRQVSATFVKAIAASLVSTVGGLLLRHPVYRLFGASLEAGHGHHGGHMSWMQAVGICVVLGAAILALYVTVLWALRTRELDSAVRGLAARFGRNKTNASEVIPTVESDADKQSDKPLATKSATRTIRSQTPTPEAPETSGHLDFNATPGRPFGETEQGRHRCDDRAENPSAPNESKQGSIAHDASHHAESAGNALWYETLNDFELPENLTPPTLTPFVPYDSQSDDTSGGPDSHTDRNVNQGVPGQGNVADDSHTVGTAYPADTFSPGLSGLVLGDDASSSVPNGKSHTGDSRGTSASSAMSAADITDGVSRMESGSPVFALPLEPKESPVPVNATPRSLFAEADPTAAAVQPMGPLPEQTHVRGDISWIPDDPAGTRRHREPVESPHIARHRHRAQNSEQS